jgi:hypothetical protein
MKDSTTSILALSGREENINSFICTMNEFFKIIGGTRKIVSAKVLVDEKM